MSPEFPAQILRPNEAAAPDIRARSFRAQARAQAQAVAASPHAAEDQAFIDAVSAIDLADDSDLSEIDRLYKIPHTRNSR